MIDVQDSHEGGLMECAGLGQASNFSWRWRTFTLIQGASAQLASCIDCNAIVVQASNWT